MPNYDGQRQIMYCQEVALSKLIICDQKEAVGAWVAQKIGNETPWTNYETVGIYLDGNIIGGAVIDNYIKESRCSVHCAGDGKNWCNREFLFAVFDYIFRQLKCNAVLNIVHSENHASLRFTAHVGFKEVHRIKGGSYNGNDAVLFEMQKENCRWIKPKQRKVNE